MTEFKKQTYSNVNFMHQQDELNNMSDEEDYVRPELHTLISNTVNDNYIIQPCSQCQIQSYKINNKVTNKDECNEIIKQFIRMVNSPEYDIDRYCYKGKAKCNICLTKYSNTRNKLIRSKKSQTSLSKDEMVESDKISNTSNTSNIESSQKNSNIDLTMILQRLDKLESDKLRSENNNEILRQDNLRLANDNEILRQDILRLANDNKILRQDNIMHLKNYNESINHIDLGEMEERINKMFLDKDELSNLDLEINSIKSDVNVNGSFAKIIIYNLVDMNNNMRHMYNNLNDKIKQVSEMKESENKTKIKSKLSSNLTK